MAFLLNCRSNPLFLVYHAGHPSVNCSDFACETDRCHVQYKKNWKGEKAMHVISTPNAPAAIGPYSQAIAAGGLIFTSGQIALDPKTGMIQGAAIEEQTEQAIRNLLAVLAATGSGGAHVIKTTCFLQRMSDFAAFNAVYEKYFPGKPARSCVEVAALPKGALVEIEAVAVKADK